jgi:hypothetical protein
VAFRLFLKKALELMVTVGASEGLVKESCGKLFTGVKTPCDRLCKPATRSMLQMSRSLRGASYLRYRSRRRAGWSRNGS